MEGCSSGGDGLRGWWANRLVGCEASRTGRRFVTVTIFTAPHQANQRQEMVQLLASVLSLGNIEFESDVEGGGVDDANEGLVAAATYMQVAPAALLKALTIKVLQVPGSGPIERQQSGQACTEMRGESTPHQVQMSSCFIL